jgi:hypothetical protein
MATRSTIMMQDKDGTFKGIYCHFDGYLSNVGKLLLEHYQDENKVRALIDLGAISSLEREVFIPEDVNHSYESPADGITIAYHRDRGEEIEYTRCVVGNTINEVKDRISNFYNYLYIDGIWHVNSDVLDEIDEVSQYEFENVTYIRLKAAIEKNNDN